MVKTMVTGRHRLSSAAGEGWGVGAAYPRHPLLSPILRGRGGWIIGFCCLVAASAAQAAPRAIWFGPPEAGVAFRAYGLGLVPIDAHFTRFGGRLIYDPANRADCRVELTAEVDSLVTDDPDKRPTAIGPDFLDAAKFPILTYTGACGPDGLDGTLRMHGVSRPFALSLDWDRTGVVAEGRLVRADWGMTAMPLRAGRTVRIRVTVPLPAG